MTEMEPDKRKWLGTFRNLKYLIKKPKFSEESLSETEICRYCHKPARVFWLDRPANIGHGEPLYDGMHLECYRECKGHQPNLFLHFVKDTVC